MKTKGNGWTRKPKLRRISSAAPSTTRTTLRIYFHPCFLPKNCSNIRWGENRRESKKYSILKFSVLRNIKEKRGDEIHRFRRNFESFPLGPLRYRCVFGLLSRRFSLNSIACFSGGCNCFSCFTRKFSCGRGEKAGTFGRFRRGRKKPVTE